MNKYFVKGGVYTDTTFEFNVTYEEYGPFATFEEASKVWKTVMWQNVDNALHRLTIVEMPD